MSQPSAGVASRDGRDAGIGRTKEAGRAQCAGQPLALRPQGLAKGTEQIVRSSQLSAFSGSSG
jgi:hypothetical protein